MTPRAFERPAAIALPGAAGERGEALEGLHVPAPEEPARAAVIAPPHPLYGGSMDNPVVTEIAHACQAAGLPSLRFNWRGVGASAGEVTGDEGVADEDYRAALAFMADDAPVALVACGYSFGAAAAVRAGQRHPRVAALLLVAPPPSLLDVDALRAFRGPVLVAVGERDALASPDALERMAGELPRARFVPIPETDHFFMSGLGELGAAAAEWLKSTAD